MQDNPSAMGGDDGACTGGAPNPWETMTEAELAAMTNRFGGQGQVCDMGGAEVFINGQQLPRDAMGYPCDPQNPCDFARTPTRHKSRYITENPYTSKPDSIKKHENCRQSFRKHDNSIPKIHKTETCDKMCFSAHSMREPGFSSPGAQISILKSD